MAIAEGIKVQQELYTDALIAHAQRFCLQKMYAAAVGPQNLSSNDGDNDNHAKALAAAVCALELQQHHLRQHERGQQTKQLQGVGVVVVSADNVDCCGAAASMACTL